MIGSTYVFFKYSTIIIVIILLKNKLTRNKNYLVEEAS